MRNAWIAVNTDTRHGLTDIGWQPCYQNVHGHWILGLDTPKWITFDTKDVASKEVARLDEDVNAVEFFEIA